MARLQFMIAVLLCVALPASAASDRRILLYQSFARPPVKERSVKPKRTRMVEPDFTALEAPALRRNETARIERRLTAALFDDTIVHIELDSVERNAIDAIVWSGKIEGEEHSAVTLVVKDRSLVATISTLTQRYMIEPTGPDTHEVVDLDLAAFPAESEPIRRVSADLRATSLDTAVAADPGTLIDVLVVYTDDVRASLGSTAAAQASATNSIAATNTAYQNSGVGPRVRLVGTAEVSFAETGNLQDILIALAATNDGQMDEVHALRNQVGADSVALLALSGGNGCGIAYLMQSPSLSFAPSAFAVVANNCAVGNLSFPHELGHNFGLEHDRYVSPNGTPAYPYGFGYVDTGNQFRDIMAYANACGGCSRVQYFSSPALTYLTRPLGVSYESSPATAADNVRALNNAATVVANWRQTVIPVPVTYTPATFTDNPLVAGVTQVKALHVTEVREAINRYRVSAGLSQASWSTLNVGTVITASQISEMRTALQQALPSATFTDPVLVAGGTIKAVHIQELRNLLD